MAQHWAQAPMPREQIVLFSPTLEEAISEEHPVRLLDEILCGVEWSSWVTPCGDHRGRPPIHPRILAGIILYGLMHRFRSSRMLEYMCGHKLDFIWLAEGHRPDHTTLSIFRKESRQALKDLFRQVGRLAMAMGLVRLGEAAFDGRRGESQGESLSDLDGREGGGGFAGVGGVVRADDGRSRSSGRRGARRAASRRVGPALAGGIGEPQATAAEVARTPRQAASARRGSAEGGKKDPQKNPAQLCKADLDAKMMPNKEGGYAANYTPLAAVDVASGLIVDCEVLADCNEHPQTLPAVDRIEAAFGEKPQAFLADAAHGTGENLAGMEDRKVAFYTPMESSLPQPGNPACREDFRRPVPEEDWPNLPRNPQKQLDKSCFAYEEQADRYWCPMGQVLEFAVTEKSVRNGQKIEVRVYRCEHCEGCPLASSCRAPKAWRGRSIHRDAYEPLREAMAAKMKTPEGKAVYVHRMHGAETPFAHIKGAMGVRQFLLRGLENVRTEWRWLCTTYNVKKLLASLGTLRARVARWIAEPIS